jgi:hypothetical protein
MIWILAQLRFEPQQKFLRNLQSHFFKIQLKIALKSTETQKTRIINYFITTVIVQQRTFFLFLFLVLFRFIFFLVRSTVLAKNYQIVIRKICWASGVPVDAQKLQNSNEKRLECQ